jgi:hypothetical protein
MPVSNTSFTFHLAVPHGMHVFHLDRLVASISPWRVRRRQITLTSIVILLRVCSGNVAMFLLLQQQLELKPSRLLPSQPNLQHDLHHQHMSLRAAPTSDSKSVLTATNDGGTTGWKDDDTGGGQHHVEL